MNKKMVLLIASLASAPLAVYVGSARAEKREQIALAAEVAKPDQARFHAMIDVASSVYSAIAKGPHGTVPESVLVKSRCIVVLPNVMTGAILLGGSHGSGLASCKSEAGNWSQPAAISLNQASIGLQAGVKAADLVLFIQTKEAEQALKKGEFTLGSDVSAVAGKYDSGFDSSGAGVVAFNRAEGLFAGASISGGKVSRDQGEIARYYGKDVDYQALLDGQASPDSSGYTQKLTQMFPR